MTPETDALVAELRAAYREALVAQDRREAAQAQLDAEHKTVRAAWDRVYRLQMQLQSGSEGGTA